MEPTINEGSKILCERVRKEDIEYLNGGVYAILFDHELVIKRVIDHELQKKKPLMLHSDNPNYGSLPVSLDEIRCMWKILGVYQTVN